jgi:L-threonylcarbamoyladenylate synthase
VLDDLPDVAVVEGGDCVIGIESTVVRVEGSGVSILRPGQVSGAELLDVASSVFEYTSSSVTAESPGQQPRHYAPSVPCRPLHDAPQLGAGALLISDLAFDGFTVRMPADPVGYGKRLYAALRELEACGVNEILIELPPSETPWSAVHDRLRRAMG